MVDPILALCARAQRHPAQSRMLLAEAQRASQWETMPQRAESNGLAPLTFFHLRASGISIPEQPRRALSALFLRHRRANHIRVAVLVEILAALREIEIDALVLKGAALANTVYPQPGLRPMRDIDILVREGDALPAQRRLADLGFRAEQPPAGVKGARHHLPIAQRLVDGLLVSVEIHHRLLPYATGPPTFEELSHDRIAFCVNGAAAGTLGHEDMLGHIYHHAFARPLIEQPIRLIWVADFVSLVERYVDEIDWEKVENSYPQVWNVLPAFHFLTPWSDKVLNTLDIDIDPPPQGIGQTFKGWPQSSLAQQRQKGISGFLVDTFWPSEWWMQLYYGVSRRPLTWWWTRLVRHPLHIAGWLLQYLRNRA